MPEERMLIALRCQTRGEVEAEPVLISVSPDGRCEMTLDEGDALTFDLAELLSVLNESEAA